MDSEFDLARLERLQELLGTALPEIVATLVSELANAVDQLESALRDGDLDAGALAAHAARNSALMVGAADMLSALRAVEQGARNADLEAARAGLQLIRESWPPLRRRLELVARENN